MWIASCAAVLRYFLLAALIVFGRAEATPLQVYGRLPTLENVAISPDGTRLAFVRTDGDARVLAVASLETGKLIGSARVGKTKIRAVRWADDTHLIIITSTTEAMMEFSGGIHEWSMLQVYDIEKKQLTNYPSLGADSSSTGPGGPEIMNVIVGYPEVRHIDGHTVLFVEGIYVTSLTLPALFRIDLNTRSQRLVRQGGETTQGWVVDDAGEVAAEEDYFEHDRRWSLRYRKGGSLTDAAFGHEAIDVPELLGFGPTDDTLLVSSVEKGESIWRLFSLKDGTLGEPMADQASLNSPIEDITTHRMIGGVHTDDDAHYIFFDAGRQKWWDSIARAFPHSHVDLVSTSADFNKVVVRVDGPDFGYCYQLIDRSTHKATLVGDVYTGLTDPLPVQKIEYPAADGLVLTGYLTLPKGRDPKHLPLIVFPHGGPADRDTAEFDWWSQALADQGYAVLQPNYRGSTVSDELLEAGYGEWGRKMQTDLSDGVRYLVKQETVDPTRVCIVGASYGGYAALAGATLDADVYRCAVSVAGIGDLHEFLSWVHSHHSQISTRYWDRFMGVSSASDPKLDEISPVRHLDAVKAPVLLIHGRDDTVVPFQQSQEMYDALKRANKPVELVDLKHEDHWLSGGETREQMLEASVAFLKKYNPPDP